MAVEKYKAMRYDQRKNDQNETLSKKKDTFCSIQKNT